MLPQRNSLLGNNRLLYPLSSAKVDIFFHPSTITSAFNHGSSLKELWWLLFLGSKYTPLYSIQWMQMSSLFLSLSFYGLRLVLIDQSKYLCLSGKRYIGFAQEVYTFFYVMYTACDEENMTLRKFRRQERYRKCLFLAAQTDNHFAQREVCETSNMFGIAQLPLICLSKSPIVPRDPVKTVVRKLSAVAGRKKANKQAQYVVH